MAVAHDSETLGAANSTAGNYDTSITPTSTPNGVCVIIVNSTAATDVVTSVTYGISTGSVPLVRRRFNTEATEPGGVFLYWAGGVLFPSGTQTVRVVRTGTNNLRAYIGTMTCAPGQQVAVDTDATGTSASVANPSWAMTTTDPNTQCYLGIHSGIDTMLNTPAASWTLGSTGFEDVGTVGRGWARRAATAAANQLPGWTLATPDDYVGASVAFKEMPLPLSGGPLWSQRSPRPAEQHTVVGNYAPVSPSAIVSGG